MIQQWLCSHIGHTSHILELTDSVEHHYLIMGLIMAIIVVPLFTFAMISL